MKENGLYIINGYIGECKEGKITYLGAASRSAVDYIIANRRVEKEIEEIEIEEGLAPDHQYQKVNLKAKIEKRKEKKYKYTERFKKRTKKNVYYTRKEIKNVLKLGRTRTS